RDTFSWFWGGGGYRRKCISNERLSLHLLYFRGLMFIATFYIAHWDVRLQERNYVVLVKCLKGWSSMREWNYRRRLFNSLNSSSLTADTMLCASRRGLTEKLPVPVFEMGERGIGWALLLQYKYGRRANLGGPCDHCVEG
ncbi:unnamed protein product, partial [Sphacelaria rigidula]